MKRAPLKPSATRENKPPVPARKPAVFSSRGVTGTSRAPVPPASSKARTEAPKSAPHPAPASKKPAGPTQDEKQIERAVAEREHLKHMLQGQHQLVASLEAQCEAAVHSNESRVEVHRQMQARKLRRAKDEERDLRATSDNMREEIGKIAVKQKEDAETAAGIDADTERIRSEVLPQFAATIATMDETIHERRAAVGERADGLEALRVQAKKARSITYGLSADAAAVVTQTAENKERRARIKEETMRQELDRRATFNEYEDLKGTIRVYARIKGGSKPDAPGLAKFTCAPSSEIMREDLTLTQTRLNATSTGTRDQITAHTYDKVFMPTATQLEVFAEVGNLVDSAVDGFKACAFAYGQTGSGKTHTMEGTRSDPGIIPRAINRVFERIAELQKQQWEHAVSCTFVEVYNDCIRNLLEPSEAYHREFTDGVVSQVRLKNKHDIVHVADRETTISGVKETPVRSPADIHKLLATASKNRSVAKTNMNERSSRSHSVFTMRIHSNNRTLKKSFEGILCLIDLAGSERVNESGAEGKALKEAIAINRSLMHLGECIASLSAKSAVTSWRNSRLTHLLQNFLGGQGAKMLMFVMVSDREEHASETANSLRFAAKVNSTVVGTAKKRTAQAA